MGYLIDLFYSDTLFGTIVIMVVMFTCVGFSFKNPFYNKAVNIGYKIMLYLLAFSIMFVPIFFYGGFARHINRIIIGTNTIVLFEKYERGDETGDETVCRIHILDKITGKRTSRFYIGNDGELLGSNGDTIVYINNKAVYLYDANNLSTLFSIEDNEWQTKFNELKEGIVSISSNQNNDNPQKPLIQINAKNGRTYYWNPLGFNFQLNENEDVELLKEFSTSSDRFCIYKSKYNSHCIANFNSTKNYQIKTLEVTEYGKNLIALNNNTEYLEPFVMCMDTIKKIYVFGYYHTTERKEFSIQANDFNHKKLWDYACTDLDTEDRYNAHLFSTKKYNKGILYFNDGGFLLAIAIETGKIIWKTRL